MKTFGQMLTMLLRSARRGRQTTQEDHSPVQAPTILVVNPRPPTPSASTTARRWCAEMVPDFEETAELGWYED